MDASASCTPHRENVSEEQLQQEARENLARSYIQTVADELHQIAREADADEMAGGLDRAAADLDVLRDLASGLREEQE